MSTTPGISFSYMEPQVPAIVEHVLGEAILTFRYDALLREDIQSYVETRVVIRLREKFSLDFEVGFGDRVLAGAKHHKIIEKVMEEFNHRFSILEQIAVAAQDLPPIGAALSS